MSIIDNIQNTNEKFNITYSKNGCQSKVLTLDDIPNTVALYKMVFELLAKQGNAKFIHPLNEEKIEEIVCSKEQAILGYFKDKQLMGALYTKPFEKNSPYFKTPLYDKDKISYTLGGFAVDPKFRGQGVITKLAGIIHGGVKSFAVKNPEENISGIGAEISCENFSSLSSAKILKDEEGKNMLNFIGYHFIPNAKDNDLTVLGYNSFSSPIEQISPLPSAVLNGNQSDSLISLAQLTQSLANETTGLTSSNVGGHIITTLNSYVSAPYSEVLTLDKGEMEQ